MKNPNGYGTIYKLPGRRRKPYTIRMAKMGEDGTIERQYVGYFATRTEAMAELMELNQANFTLDTNATTFSNVYNMFKKNKFPTVSEDTVKTYERSYHLCKPLHDTPFVNIRTRHLQELIDTIPRPYTQRRTKTLLIGMFEMAIKYDMVIRNYAEHIEIGSLAVKNPHRVLKRAEIEKILDSVKNPQTTLISTISPS